MIAHDRTIQPLAQRAHMRTRYRTTADATTTVGGTVRVWLVSCAAMLALALIPGTRPLSVAATAAAPPIILVFTRTTGYRHASIPTAVAAVRAIGRRDGFAVVATEDPHVFADVTLRRVRAVAFLLTTGTVLDMAQRAALERFVRHGGGWLGVHSASDTAYAWPFYGRLVGAYFRRHPAIQLATVDVADRRNPATAPLPAVWRRVDEWYDFRGNPRGRVHVLATVDERSYRGGGMGVDHPIVWCHEDLGGRALYTAMGHTSAAYHEPLFLAHLRGALDYVLGRGPACR
jgi:cytochrome c